jgi:hypothetical protein
LFGGGLGLQVFGQLCADGQPGCSVRFLAGGWFGEVDECGADLLFSGIECFECLAIGQFDVAEVEILFAITVGSSGL